MGLQRVVDHPPHCCDIALTSRWVDAEDVAAFAQALRFVDGAGIGNQVAQRRRGAIAIAFEEARKLIEEESTAFLQPARKCVVMERHQRRDPVLPAGGQNTAVMVERRVRELVLLRLDPGRLEAEAECIEAEPGHQRDVLSIPVVEVARVARWLYARRSRAVLPFPPVAGGIAAFDLVRRGCGAEEETFRKSFHQLLYIRDLPSFPRPEYPRPTLRRGAWVNLNGELEVAFYFPRVDRWMSVPFAYHTGPSCHVAR